MIYLETPRVISYSINNAKITSSHTKKGAVLNRFTFLILWGFLFLMALSSGCNGDRSRYLKRDGGMSFDSGSYDGGSVLAARSDSWGGSGGSSSDIEPGSVNANQTPDSTRPEEQTFNVNPNQDQVLTTNSGITIAFSSGVFETASGETPPDNATFTLTSYLKESGGRLTDMPGGFKGVDQNGNTVALVSYGVIGVSATAGGEELKIKSGQLVSITIPAISTDGPSTISLWHRKDESSSSMWQEDGEAHADDYMTHYSAEVSHFSLWNADVACNNACMKVQAENRDGTKIVGLIIRAVVTQTSCQFASPGALSGGFCITDGEGKCTIENLPGGSTFTVSGEYLGETATDTQTIPSSGSDCVDGPKLLFGKEPAPDGGTATPGELHPSCAGLAEVCHEANPDAECGMNPCTRETCNQYCYDNCVNYGGVLCDPVKPVYDSQNREQYFCGVENYWEREWHSPTGNAYSLCEKGYTPP